MQKQDITFWSGQTISERLSHGFLTGTIQKRIIETQWALGWWIYHVLISVAWKKLIKIFFQRLLLDNIKCGLWLLLPFKCRLTHQDLEARSILVQITYCRFVGAKALSEPMLVCYYLDGHLRTNLSDILMKYCNFYTRKWILNIVCPTAVILFRLQYVNVCNGSHSVMEDGTHDE